MRKGNSTTGRIRRGAHRCSGTGVDAGAPAPLAAGLASHAGEGYLGFHMPGHHQGRAAWAPWRHLLGEAVFDLDLTELPGLDNLQDPQGIIREAESAAAACFGAAQTHLLVNGASAGILAVLLTLCREKDLVLVPRHCHQSVVHGLVLSGATPVYLPVHFHPGLGLPGLLRTDDLRRALKTEAGAVTNNVGGFQDVNGRQPERGGCGNTAAADRVPERQYEALRLSEHSESASEQKFKLLVLLHPSYYGLAGDLERQVELAHQQGLPVLADEAHGSHFCASPQFPVPALSAGADFTVMGAHKTLGAFTQAAWLHCREGGEAAARVGQALRLVQTTSPSYLLMASLDVARLQLQQTGERWEETARLGRRLREEISRITGLRAPGEELLDVPGVAAYDPARLIVNVRGLGITGFAAAGWLARERRLLVEMADPVNLVLILGPGDEGAAAEALLGGLRDLAAASVDDGGALAGGGRSRSGANGEHDGTAVNHGVDRCAGAGVGCPATEAGASGRAASGGHLHPQAAPGAGAELSAIMTDLYDLPIPRQALTPRQAFFAPQRPVPLAEAAGKIAAVTITPYPPGVPVLCPGEVIDQAALKCLEAWRHAGGIWPGIDGDAVCVVDDS